MPLFPPAQESPSHLLSVTLFFTSLFPPYFYLLISPHTYSHISTDAYSHIHNYCINSSSVEPLEVNTHLQPVITNTPAY